MEYGLIGLAAGLGAGLVTMGAAMGIGKITAAAAEATGRQPEAANDIRTTALIMSALIAVSYTHLTLTTIYSV